MSEGLDETWPISYRPEATMATPSMLDHQVELFLFVVAEPLGADLADLIAAGEPADLHVDRACLGLTPDPAGEGGKADCRRGRSGELEEIPAT